MNQIKPSYIVIPLIIVAVAVVGNIFTSAGLENWYPYINLPTWTPSGSVIGAVWFVIYLLTAVAAILVWERMPHGNLFAVIVGLFLSNAFLNVFWSYMFFKVHLLLASIFEAALLALTVYAIIWLVWSRVRLAAYLLIPYAAWASFATFLTYSIWALNK